MHAEPPARVRTRGPAASPLLATAAGAGGLVLLLWVTVAVSAPTSADRGIYRRLHGSPGTTETSFARHLTFIGDGVPLFAILLALGLLCRLHWGRWEPLAVTAMAVTLAGVASTVVKVAAGRDRPPTTGWLASARGNSFPSGHTTASTAGYVALALCVAVLAASVRQRVLALVAGAGMAVAVGWTRVELGVHWPSDVLAGWAVGGGAACAALACWVLAPPTLRP
jgi:undecaprenyl-diphosphatase